MKSAWRSVIALVLAGIIIFSLMACSGTTKVQPTTKESSASTVTGTQSASSAKTEKVTLRFMWWGGDVRHQKTYAAIDAYMKKNPNVVIKGEFEAWGTFFEKLLTQLAGGNGPDMTQLDFQFLGDLIGLGKPYVDMGTMGDKIDMSGFDMKNARQYGGGDDYLMGLPTGLNGFCNFYNADLAKKLGIDMTNSNKWSWEDIIKIGSEIHEKNPKVWMLYNKKEFWIHFVKVYLKQNSGKKLIADDGTLGYEKEELVEVFKMLRRLIDTNTVPPFEVSSVYATQDADNPDWLNQQYVMVSTFAALLGAFIDASPFDTDSTRYPIKEGAIDTGIQAMPTNYIGIDAKSKHIDEAAAFMNWFLNDEEAITILGDCRGVPPTEKGRKLLLEKGLIRETIKNAVDYAMANKGNVIDNKYCLSTEVTNRLFDYIQEVGFGRQTPEEAVDNLSTELEKILATMKKG